MTWIWRGMTGENLWIFGFQADGSSWMRGSLQCVIANGWLLAPGSFYEQRWLNLMSFCNLIFFLLVFIVVNFVYDLCVFMYVILIIPPCMAISFLLRFLSMVVDFSYTSMFIVVVFHLKWWHDLEKSRYL